MAGILGLFGIGSRANSAKPQSLNNRAQSSIQSRPIAVGAGQNRLAGNIVWYGDYKAKAVSSSSNAGGKGGAGGSGKGAPTSYNYSASFMVSIGSPIQAVQMVQNGNEYDFFYTPPPALIADLAAIGITPTYKNQYDATFILGTDVQTPWAYLVSAHPDQALAYRGESLACFPNLGLGSSPTLPNFNFEVLWALNSDIPALGPDANAADWVTQLLTNPAWGMGFPVALLGSLDDFRLWGRATGMLVSPVLTDQSAAQSHLTDLMQGMSAEFVWSGGQLTVVPYADAAVTGHGYTYTPATPVYDLGEFDFKPAQGGNTAGEVSRVNISRADPIDVFNQVRIEYLDRATLYNPVPLTDSDSALIVAANRTKPTDTRTQHFFCTVDAASMAVALQMRRLKVLRTFYFSLPPQFVLLDAMDLVTLTVPRLGLNRQGVRIKEITEADDGGFDLIAEEYLGAVGTPLYPRQQPLGAGRNNNQDPGAVQPPIIFEPTDALSGGLAVWLGITGVDLNIWGGCNVWLASDPAGTYQQVARINGSSRMGVTTNTFPSVPPLANPPTIDSTHTLSVDLTESEGELLSGALSDMLALNTASYIGGEVVAYQNATLTAPNAYDLTPVLRGAFDTAISNHASGEPFLRLDDQVVKIPYTQDRIGQQIYLKFQSFNIYGGGLQDLADVGSLPYTIKGTALASPLPPITEIRATFIDKTSAITWVEIDDFRAVRYEVRRGDTWEAGLNLGTVAHPPFVTYGDGKYWVKGRSEPAAGLIVYSDIALSYEAVGTVIPDNLVGSYDEPSTGWTGTITGPGAIVGGNFVTTASNAVAYYEVPAGHVFDVQYDREIRINATWAAQGVAVGSDFLADPDFLNNPDIFGSGASVFIDSWVETFVTVGAAGDVYDAADVYALPDVYGGSVGSWERFAPGVKFGRREKSRIAIISYSDSVQAVATAFRNSVGVPTRVDHLTNHALASGGETFTFMPDGSSTPVPFIFGPNGATVPQVFAGIQDQQAGDQIIYTSPSLSQITIQIKNAGVGVARTINVTVEGA